MFSPPGTPPPAASTPGAAARVAATLVLVAAVACALIRVQSVNLPWHLATARMAAETGHWPARNSFSYTFPDYPIYQQYPVFQGTLWAVFQVAGWPGLSVLIAVGWVAVFLLFVRWAGPFAVAARHHVVWILALLALQRRMVLRPDLFTMLAFGAEVVAVDAVARGRTRALAALPIIHLFWANSHQLFPISFIVQGLLVADLVRRRERARARWALVALAASGLLTLATPLGWRIVLTPLHTAHSLSAYRGQVAELHRIWTMPYELVLGLATAVPAAWAVWRSRRTIPRYELGVWLLSVGLAISAVRGLMFSSVVSAAVFQRCGERLRAEGGALLPPIGAGTRRALRAIGFAFTALIATSVVYYRWVHPTPKLGGTQPGLGRCVGGWAEAATDFVRRAPPPGRMLNLGADVGDDVIFWLPGLPVFVDSRMESYPPDFIRDVLAAEHSDRLLDDLLARFGPDWAFLEHARPGVRDRAVTLLRRGWRPVYVDSAYVILVRSGPLTAGYVRDHAIDLLAARPGDLAVAAGLRQQQEATFERFLAAVRPALGGRPEPPAGNPGAASDATVAPAGQ